jgi:small neutral amino acid transporter SnatA (MarC family)
MSRCIHRLGHPGTNNFSKEKVHAPDLATLENEAKTSVSRMAYAFPVRVYPGSGNAGRLKRCICCGGCRRSTADVASHCTDLYVPVFDARAVQDHCALLEDNEGNGCQIYAFLGEKILSNFGIPLPVLALSVGIILFLVALKTVLEQFAPPHSEEIAGQALTPTMSMAMTPLAFPTIVTPYGIGALVVFLALSPDLNTQLTIGAIVLVIMLLNLTVMMLTPHIRPLMGAALAILGAVLGIIQVALGLQIIHTSLKALGIL